jgi:hypothetical protein
MSARCCRPGIVERVWSSCGCTLKDHVFRPGNGPNSQLSHLVERYHAISSIIFTYVLSVFNVLSNVRLTSCSTIDVPASDNIINRSRFSSASVWNTACMNGTYTNPSCAMNDTDTVITNILFSVRPHANPRFCIADTRSRNTNAVNV